MTSHRPDPDHLLAQLARDERPRGRLRIYFGASAGVGKTYAMLAAAHKRQAEGQHPLVGIIETHGRAETAELLQGLELLPRKPMGHRGKAIEEFDLDAALARHPALILVDELAHSNAPGSRHPKRWQDVEELLAAGIDVFTTLNVQHLESLNDVVGGITGIRVNETLPDTVFDAADEVVLVDLPADELLARLQAGKVYLPAQAEQAARHFFRKGNLIALREIALRRTARRLEDEVRAYRIEQSIDRVWQTDAGLLAAIGPHSGGEQVARAAARLAGELNGAWHAVYVETPTLQRLPRAEREAILRNLKRAEELGARTAVLTCARDGDHAIAAQLAAYTRQYNIARVVLGRPTKSHRLRLARHTLAGRLAAQGAEFDLIEVGIAQATRSVRRPSEPEEDSHKRTRRLRAYALAALACGLTAALTAPLAELLDIANIAMLFLLTVVLVAVRWGRSPAVLASVLGVLMFDFFFVPPRLSFTVNDAQYLITFGVMLAVGLTIGQLTASLRYQARVAAHREARAYSLYEFARDLSAALQVEQVTAIATTVLEPAFRAQVALLLPDAHDRLQASPTDIDLDSSIAQWAYDHNEAAGFATDTLPANPYRYLPLKAPMRVRGVLAVRPDERRWLLSPEQNRQLDTYAALIAIALERIHYIEVARDALIDMESETLRSSLLAAMSHDLRTPLTAMIGLADTLTLTQPPLSAAQQDIAQELRGQAERLNALVVNLLDMARLMNGRVRLKREWLPLEEVIGSALHGLRPVLASRPVKVHSAPDLPLVHLDAVLIERVLANLLENACKYTPTNSAIEIEVNDEGEALRVSVRDHGPGVPAGMEQAVFEKFTRGVNESATTGVGLGLAICRAIVDAHGGRIGCDNPPDGGARFSFTLPKGEPPPDVHTD